MLEELRHNINLCAAYCEIIDERSFYNEVYKEIKKLKNNETYPINIQQLSVFFSNIRNNTINSSSLQFIKLRNNFICSAISSKSYFHLKNHRIFLNLGHLNFSILRHNGNVEKFNNDPKLFPFKTLQDEYLYWLHFRLHLMLVDLISSVNGIEIIDRDYLNKLKGYLKNN